MKKTNKLAFAVYAASVVMGLAGCATNQVVETAGIDAAQAPVVEHKVLRALPSYGSMGGYRYRRFAVVTVEG